jgi:hypothetical protein
VIEGIVPGASVGPAWDDGLNPERRGGRGIDARPLPSTRVAAVLGVLLASFVAA